MSLPWPPRTPIGACSFRCRACVAGTVQEVKVQTASAPVLSVLLGDGSGTMRLVFLGRRQVPGIVEGTQVQAEGMVGRFRGELAIVNPRYRFVGDQ